ncbi:beta-1,3-galactosyltransferase 5-like [Paramacrobiotus metropolitanus]|uniref:beta-1,3-galactosyltransferase 5-like n=1 Tax=Paramacrobiotus metropolitanus TaxID=2943436 RepID=UPI002445F843|nr:beta-1,3-galactosyltransferase 5-like [Paramacrobiotus metropolitanus]
MAPIPTKLLIPLILALIFIAGFFMGNFSSSGPTRVVLRDGSGQTNNELPPSDEFPDTTDEYGRILVDLSAPIPTPPSLTVLSNKIDHEPPSCTSFEQVAKPSKFTFVIFIFTWAKQIERRKAMRETWGSLATTDCGFRLIFVLGLQNETPGTQAECKKIQAHVDDEARQFKDILQFGHFIDNSRTSTQKATMTFEWSLRECPNAEYTLKGEDHVWVNLPDFTKWIKEQKGDSIMGHRVYGGSVVFRDPQSFFYVSRDDWIDDTYPEYMTSMMYAIPQKILKTLVDKAKTMKQMPLEDVFFTGIVADAAKVPRLNHESYEYDYIIDKNKKIGCPKKDLLAVRYMPPTEQYKYWEDKCHTITKPCFA